MIREDAEQYQHPAYARIPEIENPYLFGMSFDELTDREASLALRSSEMHIQPGDKILDLACGIGKHAEKMRDMTGANVDGVDLSPPLIEEANRRTQRSDIAADIRGQLNFSVGNIMELPEHVPHGKRYKLVTCLGDSFIYFPTREKIVAALKNMRSVLAPGGKLVLQFRDWVKPRNPEARESWAKPFGIEFGRCTAEGPHGNFGKCFPKGEKIYYFRDTEKGDGDYVHESEPQVPEGFNILRNQQLKVVGMADNQGRMLNFSVDDRGRLKEFTDADGYAHSAFERVYRSADGKEERMGISNTTSLSDLNNVKTLEGMLKEAGFQDVKIESEPLSPDKHAVAWVAVAE